MVLVDEMSAHLAQLKFSNEARNLNKDSIEPDHLKQGRRIILFFLKKKEKKINSHVAH